jgi:hypothetical protein
VDRIAKHRSVSSPTLYRRPSGLPLHGTTGVLQEYSGGLQTVAARRDSHSPAARYLVAQRATAAPPDQPSYSHTRTSARGLVSACWGRCVCGGEARRTKVDPMAAAAAAAEGAHSSESGGARAEAAAETAARRAYNHTHTR